MKYAGNPLVAGVETPPIAEARSWIAGRDFPADKPLIDVSQAVPGYLPDAGLTGYLADEAQVGDTSLYTDIEGVPALRNRLADHMSGFYAGTVTPEQICITAGCNQAFYLAAATLARAGDTIVLPSPFYFNHRMTLDMLGIKAALLPCREENGLLPDPAEAAALIDDRTRAIVLVTPNNPTGAVYPPDLLDAFMNLARERSIAMVVDETYKDFLPAGAVRPHGLLQRPDWTDNLIQLYSFSKSFCIPGYRVGSVIAAPNFIVDLAKVMDCVSICAPHIGQKAALFGLRNLDAWRDEKRDLMNHRMARFTDALTSRNTGWHIASMGAYFAYLKHPFEGDSSAKIAERLAVEQNLLCLPGTMFGPDQERFLRFAFANVDDTVMPAIADRLTGL